MKIFKLSVLFLLFLLLFFFALSFGDNYINIFSVIFENSSLNDIVFNFRFPRVIMGFLVGASLGTSGAAFQSIFKNPLADPYIVGISSGAAFGVTISVVLNLPLFFVVLFSFVGSMVVALLVLYISSNGGYSSSKVLLVGLAISFILSSAVLLLYLFSNSDDVHKALMWLVGNLSISRFSLIPYMSILAFIAFLVLFFHSRQLDILSFGQTFSKNLGVSTLSLRIIFISASFLTSISISLGGVVGFVGLVAPHIVRRIFGPSHNILIPFSALFGGGFLIICDTFGRSIVSPYEIPVGIITGFIGGIFFLTFIIRKGVVA